MKKNKNDLLYDLESEYNPTDYYNESARRDVYYSALVKDIVKDNRTSKTLKIIFFIIVCFVFLGICVVGMVIIYNISSKANINYADLGIVISGAATILSSVIVLPRIIADHLFPKNSEEVRFGFIKNNQINDQSYLMDDTIDQDGINGSEANEKES